MKDLKEKYNEFCEAIIKRFENFNVDKLLQTQGFTNNAKRDSVCFFCIISQAMEMRDKDKDYSFIICKEWDEGWDTEKKIKVKFIKLIHDKLKDSIPYLKWSSEEVVMSPLDPYSSLENYYKEKLKKDKDGFLKSIIPSFKEFYETVGGIK